MDLFFRVQLKICHLVELNCAASDDSGINTVTTVAVPVMK